MKFKWIEQLELVFKFINTTGRMKYVRPLYRYLFSTNSREYINFFFVIYFSIIVFFRDLYSWEEVRTKTIENFENNKMCMMYVCRHTVAKDLQLRD